MTHKSARQENNVLRQYIELSGTSQARLAKKIGVAQPSLWKWINGKGRIPATRVLQIEEITGLSRKKLRPDVFGSD